VTTTSVAGGTLAAMASASAPAVTTGPDADRAQRAAVAARTPRIVLVTRPTDYELLLARHGTREQARFFLSTRGQRLADVEERHQLFAGALQLVSQAIPVRWRRSRIDRADLSRFVFEPDDVVVALGQDGLVANVAKYLSGQAVIGINPDPRRYDGILVPHPPSAAADLLHAAAERRCAAEERTMVEAVLDDGQRLLALNEVFVGHATHQSARYRIRFEGRDERQSSSGLIVATGTGASGWARSIHRQRAQPPPLPGCLDRWLAFFVREPFPSVASSTAIEQGRLPDGEALEIVSEMNEGGTLFGDGIEEDRLAFGWGQRVVVGVAREKLRLVK
jgi:NAD kinase